jgi:hypothetical protein
MTARPTLATVNPDTLEPASAFDATALQSGLWTQEVLLGINAEGGAIDPRACVQLPWTKRNELTNGGFEVSQRGAGPWDASVVDVCPSDGWQASFGTWSRETTTVDGSPTSLKATAASGTAPYVKQRLLAMGHLRGRTVTLSGRVRCDGGLDDVLNLNRRTRGRDGD